MLEAYVLCRYIYISKLVSLPTLKDLPFVLYQVHQVI